LQEYHYVYKTTVIIKQQLRTCKNCCSYWKHCNSCKNW